MACLFALAGCGKAQETAEGTSTSTSSDDSTGGDSTGTTGGDSTSITGGGTTDESSTGTTGGPSCQELEQPDCCCINGDAQSFTVVCEQFIGKDCGVIEFVAVEDEDGQCIDGAWQVQDQLVADQVLDCVFDAVAAQEKVQFTERYGACFEFGGSTRDFYLTATSKGFLIDEWVADFGYSRIGSLTEIDREGINACAGSFSERYACLLNHISTTEECMAFGF